MFFKNNNNPNLKEIAISQETFTKLMLLAQVEDKTFDELISNLLNGISVTL